MAFSCGTLLCQKNKEWQWIPWAWCMSRVQIDAFQLQWPSKLPELDNSSWTKCLSMTFHMATTQASENVRWQALCCPLSARLLDLFGSPPLRRHPSGMHLGCLCEKRFLKLALQRFEITRNNKVQKICGEHNLPSGCQQPACRFLHVCRVAKQDSAPSVGSTVQLSAG